MKKIEYKKIASSAIRRRGGYKIISLLSTLMFLGSFRVCLGFWGIDVFPSLAEIQMSIANVILTLASKVLWVAGILFNYSMSYTLNIATVIDNVGVVNIGWEIFRDLSNMVFIFILLLISIATILGLEKYNAKNLLVKVILVALLINFSLFTTKVIIDASNVFTVGFYNATISGTTGGEVKKEEDKKPLDKGISAIFAQSLKLHTIYDHETLTVEKNAKGNKITPKNIWTICIFGSLFLLVTAFVFFAASILLIKRMVVLMFLMMISPLAFLGMILPATQAHSAKWWKMLFAESFYAPIYMMFTYVVASGITSKAFRDTMGLSGAGDKDTFASVLTGTAGDGMSFVIFNFILIIGLMIASIISAATLGATGAGGMIAMGKKMQTWGQSKIGAGTFGAGGRLGRRFVGGGAQRGAEALAKSGWAKKGGFGSKLALKTLRGVGGSSFDARNTKIGKTIGKELHLGEGIKGGYKTRRDTAKKEEISYAKSLNLKDAELGTYGATKAKKSKKRSIWATVAQGAGVGVGQRQAGEALETEYIKKIALKGNQDKLKSDLGLKVERGKLRKAKDKIKDIREIEKRKPTETEKEEVYNAEDKVKEIENRIKGEIDKAKEEYNRAKDKTKIKPEATGKDPVKADELIGDIRTKQEGIKEAAEKAKGAANPKTDK